MLAKRRFGKTDAEVTIVNIGGCGIGLAENQQEADEAMKLALDYGVNMIDVAPTYGVAEERLNPWMSSIREDIFLAEKTEKRTKEGAWKEMKESMKKLGVDKFDLYQFHAVPSKEVLDQILAPGGAMETFEEARESDMIGAIGITGHDDIRVFTEAIRRYEFDTVLAPVTLTHEIDPHPANDYHPLLELAQEKDVGIQAIKSIAKRRWFDPDAEHKYNTWYEPLTQQEHITKSLWYTLSQDGVTTAPLSCDVSLWPMLLEAAERFSQQSQAELDQIITQAKKEMDMTPLFPYSS